MLLKMHCITQENNSVIVCVHSVSSPEFPRGRACLDERRLSVSGLLVGPWLDLRSLVIRELGAIVMGSSIIKSMFYG